MQYFQQITKDFSYLMERIQELNIDGYGLFVNKLLAFPNMQPLVKHLILLKATSEINGCEVWGGDELFY